jgi:hypothetical protein
LIPRIVYFRASNASRNTLGSKNIEITLTITKPSPTGSLDVTKLTGESGLVAQVPIVIKQLLPGRIRKGGPINFDTVWITTPKPPSDSEVLDAKKLVATGGTVTISPANLFLTYRETDEPDLMLSILASIVSDNSSQISTGLEDALRSGVSKDNK